MPKAKSKTSKETRELLPGLRSYIVAQPLQTLSKRIYKVYWRYTFLTGRIVRFKDVHDAKGRLDGVMVFTTKLHIKPCVWHMLAQKGYPVRDRRCKDDTCMICYPENSRTLKVTGW